MMVPSDAEIIERLLRFDDSYQREGDHELRHAGLQIG